YSDLTDEERGLMEHYDKVMETDRNVGMADAAESYIKQGLNVFFVVGAAHMGGDDGVVALLESRGYNFKPVR
ncbi:MAG: TraB/GumN family protein, partial [Clostridia bacterium]|nr:TraB/GumN family protein [Clostridia bacterium]